MELASWPMSRSAILYSMFKLDNVLLLKDGEEIRMVAKQHAATVVPKLFLAFLLIVVPFFFLFPLFNSGPTGIVAFLALIIAGLILAWRAFAMWDGDAFIVSNLRAVKVNQTGIFSRTVKETALEGIVEASWEKKGPFAYLFNYGNLVITGAEKMEVRHVPKPREAHLLIQEVMDSMKAERKAAASEREDRAKRLKQAIEELDDEGLKKIEQAIRQKERGKAIETLFPAKDDDAEEEEDDADDDDDDADAEVEEIPVKKLFGSDDESNNLKPLDDED
jgi:hypothetical protein